MRSTRSTVLIVCIPLAVFLLWLPGCGADDVSEEEAAFWRDLEQRREISAKVYPDADQPGTAPQLRWDFSTGKTYSYDYSLRWKGLGAPMVGARGSLLVKGQGGGTAAVELKDTATMVSGGNRHEMADEFVPMTVKDVKEDGSMKSGEGAARLLLRLLFVLPEGPLKAGESVERTIPIPFHAGGSVVSVDARGSTTLTGYVDVDGRTCARLYTDVRARKPDVSVGKTTYSCDARVRVVSYFDVEGRSLVSAHLMLEKGVRPGKSSGAFAMLTRRP